MILLSTILSSKSPPV